MFKTGEKRVGGTDIRSGIVPRLLGSLRLGVSVGVVVVVVLGVSLATYLRSIGLIGGMYIGLGSTGMKAILLKTSFF